MAFKDLFWKSSDGEEPPAIPEEKTKQSVPTNGVRRGPVSRPSVSIPAGPSASVFERVSGPSTATSLPSQAIPVDEESSRQISDLLEQDSKEPGFREFTAQFGVLSGIIADKKQCTAAALAAVATANPRLNATQIAKAIGERLRLLTGYASSYEGESAKRQQQEAADNQRAIEEARTSKEAVEREIERLRGELTQLNSQIDTFQAGLAGVEQKYSGHRSRFTATIAAHRENLTKLLNFVAPGAPEKGD